MRVEMAEPKKGRSGASKPRTRTRKRKGHGEPGSRGLLPAEVASGAEAAPASVRELTGQLERDGAKVLAPYRDPLGGHWVLLAVLPIERVEPTPFQRDLSDAHCERLRAVIDKVGRFLDPIIVVHERDQYWTPNGNHRLSALKRLGARSVTALVVPDPQLAYRILALNTEKAHNLRERALEVVRMFRDLAERAGSRKESEFALEFEDPSLVTIGMCYQKRPRFSGGAYHPLVRRVDAFLEQSLERALTVRERRADEVLALDDLVSAHVQALRERGLTSPYLRNFVIARVNPLRFRRGAKMDWDEAMEKTTAAARKFDPAKIRPQDLAGAGGPPEEAAS